MTLSRLFIVPVTILLLTLPLAGQTQPAAPAAAPANPITSDAREAFGFMKALVLRAAEKMPEENYAFKPVPEVRSFSQLIEHFILSQNAMCAMAKGVANPNVQLDKATKAELIAALKESDATCDAAYAGLTDAQGAEVVQLYGRSRARVTGLWALAFHGYEHYGNIVTYMRLKGLVPPSSEPRK